MNKVTIAVPNRWKEGEARILLFLQEEMQQLSGAVEPYEISLGLEWDPGKIWVLDSTLNRTQQLHCETTVNILSDTLNSSRRDVWKMTGDLTDQGKREIEEIWKLLNEAHARIDP